MRAIFRSVLRKYRDASIFLKISVLFEVILIFSLSFFMLYTTHQFGSLLEEKELELAKNRIDDLSTFMQEEYNRVYSLGNYIHSGVISDIMSDIHQNESSAYDYNNIRQIQAFYSGVSYADEAISDVIFVSDRNNVYSYTRQASYEVNPSYPFFEKEEIKALLASDDNMFVFCDDPSEYCLRGRERVVSFAGKIFDASLYPRKVIVGLYMINIPLSCFDESLGTGIDTEKGSGEIVLANKQGEIIYANNSETAGTSLTDWEQQDKREVYSDARNLGLSGLSVHYRLSEETLYRVVDTMRKRMMIVLAAAILLTVFYTVKIMKIYQRRTAKILESMQELPKGNFTTRLPIESQDEIGRISDSFNLMCEQLNSYVERVYKAEIQRKNAEMNALQAQINPHFLYNTLESIKSKAVMNQDEDCAEMISILGSMFRWISPTGKKITTLDEELEYIRNYLRLQSYRYNQKLEICIQIEEEYLDYEVPKLILQPLVENVIHHALDGVERDKIIGIQVKKKDTGLEITVYDNGRGMTQERLDEINRKLQSSVEQDEFESIGLANVNQRLKLMFGQDYGVMIRSIEGLGTAVKIRVPAKEYEE